jgi:copper homeostasis protein CutC
MMKFIKTTNQYGQLLYINAAYITDITTIRHMGEDGITVGWLSGHGGVGNGETETLYGERAVQFMLDFHAMLE